jgi:hypothetical protein
MPHFECGAFDHSATSPGAISSGFATLGRRPVLGEDGGGDKARGGEKIHLLVKPAISEKSGTARRDKNRRSRVASLKLRPGSAASPASPSDDLTVAALPESATRSRS